MGCLRRDPGSDGTANEALIEVKAISTRERSDRVRVKREGTFEELLIVSIDQHFEFKTVLPDRAALNEGLG